MRPSSEMKDSGVEWIGSMPKHWGIKKLKYLVSTVDKKIESFSNYLALENVESWSGRYISTDTDVPETESKAIQKGDLLFSKLRPYLAKAIVSPFDGACSSEFIVFRKLEIERRFLFYILVSPNFIGLVDSSTYGTKMPRANWDFIGSIPIVLPNRDEQVAIAQYLDTKCSRIDRLSALSKEKIAKLRELKQSIISEAVARGLDSNAEMKDSGVEWIERIPKHWGTKKLKYLVSTVDEKIELFSNYLALENVESWSGRYISTDTDVPETESKAIQKGDLLFSKLRPYLAKAIVSPFDGACSSEFIVFREMEIERRFLFYVFISSNFIGYVDSSAYGTKMPRANWDFIGSISIVLPSKDEQVAIAQYLDEECSRIDCMIELEEQKIEKLSEYRQSMIYEYVTGKKEVPQ